MREIKYKAYIKRLKLLVPVQAIYFNDREVLVDLTDGQGDVSAFYFHEVEFLQYTGLKDKNGKEIYEGDVVKITDEFGDVTVGEVEWGLSSKNYGNYPAFCIYEFESEMNSFAAIYDSGIYEIEVIGNIYEHSHLLEQHHD